MTTDAPAADTGPLSIDQAVAQLGEERKKQEAAPAEVDATPEPEPEIEAEPTAESDAEPEEVTGDESEAEEGETDAEGEQPEQEPLDPPQFWAAEQKDLFRGLSREAQEAILSHEQTRTAATSKAMEEAASKRKAADAEIARVTQLNGALDKLIPEAVATFKSRWDGVDWDKVIEEYGAEGALKLRNQFEREQQTIQQLNTAKDQAERTRAQSFRAERAEKYKALIPDFVDEKTGPQRQQAVMDFLTKQGVDQTTIINHATAEELAIAYDAMRWREAQAKATTLATQPKKPAAQPQRPSVRPTATPGQRNHQSARLQQLSRKPSLTMDEAVEMMRLERQSQ